MKHLTNGLYLIFAIESAILENFQVDNVFCLLWWREVFTKKQMSHLMRKWTLVSSSLRSFKCACKAPEKGQKYDSLPECCSPSLYCVSEQRRLWRDCVDAFAGRICDKYLFHTGRLKWGAGATKQSCLSNSFVHLITLTHPIVCKYIDFRSLAFIQC